MASKFTGLSRNDKVSPLLSNFQKPPREPPSVDALPLSSSDEEENAVGGENRMADSDPPSDSSSLGYSRRADIGNTSFKAKAKRPEPWASQKPQKSQPQRRSTRVNTNTPGSKRAADGDDNGETDRSQASKRLKPNGKGTRGLGSQHVDDPFARNRKNKVAGYGKKAARHNFVTKFKIHPSVESDFDSEDELQSSRSASFIKPPAHSPEKRSPAKVMKVPRRVSRDSPDEISTPKPVFKKAKPGQNADESPQKPKPKFKGVADKRSRPNTRSKGPADPGETSPVAIFKVPGSGLRDSFMDDSQQPAREGSTEIIDGDDDDDDLALGNGTNGHDDKTPSKEELARSSSICPLCDEPVGEDILSAMPAPPRAGFDQQMRFCASHRKRTAQKSWVTRGYPDIDWAELDARMARHHAFLERILGGKNAGSSSHFGRLLQDKVGAGRDRPREKTDERFVLPGYYGPRGLRVMSENILEKFSPLLRQRAVQDQLVSARGSTGFVQAVLVPELAVRLIMEDMSVGPEEARRILQDSTSIGEMLQEDVRDVVAKDLDTDAEEEEASDDGYGGLDSGSDELSELSDVESVDFS